MGDAPEPGIYRNVPAHEYHSWPHVSKSRLWKLFEAMDVCYTADELKASIDAERPKTDALVYGSAVDDFLFFPQLARETYIEGPTKTRGTKAWIETADANHGKELLTPAEIQAIPRMVESIMANPLAAQLVNEDRAERQASIVWDDKETGLRCKARIDLYTTLTDPVDGLRYRAHVDLKTCRDIKWFHKDATEYGYFVQAAHYLDGTRALDALNGHAAIGRRFLFLAVDKTPHGQTGRHVVKVYEYDETQLEAAIACRDSLLRKWRRLFVDGIYPGDRQLIQPLYVPDRVHDRFGDMAA